MKRSLSLSLALLLALPACYHQVVQTGRTPAATVIDKPWVNTFIFGLVEAKPIDTRAQCPDGVATVTTEQSFLNGLVGGLTLGIYTPQHVTIACAARGADLRGARFEIQLAKDASDADLAQALRDAAVESYERHETVVVRF